MPSDLSGRKIAHCIVEFHKESYAAAVAHFERAGSMTHRTTFYWASVQLSLARVYLEAGRLGEAVETYEGALGHSPNGQGSLIDNVEGYYYLGLAYERSGWQKKAIANYELFLEIWQDADPGIPLVDEANTRLEKLQAGS